MAHLFDLLDADGDGIVSRGDIRNAALDRAAVGVAGEICPALNGLFRPRSFQKTWAELADVPRGFTLPRMQEMLAAAAGPNEAGNGVPAADEAETPTTTFTAVQESAPTLAAEAGMAHLFDLLDADGDGIVSRGDIRNAALDRAAVGVAGELCPALNGLFRPRSFQKTWAELADVPRGFTFPRMQEMLAVAAAAAAAGPNEAGNGVMPAAEETPTAASTDVSAGRGSEIVASSDRVKDTAAVTVAALSCPTEGMGMEFRASKERRAGDNGLYSGEMLDHQGLADPSAVAGTPGRETPENARGRGPTEGDHQRVRAITAMVPISGNDVPMGNLGIFDASFIDDSGDRIMAPRVSSASRTTPLAKIDGGVAISLASDNNVAPDFTPLNVRLGGTAAPTTTRVAATPPLEPPDEISSFCNTDVGADKVSGPGDDHTSAYCSENMEQDRGPSSVCTGAVSERATTPALKRLIGSASTCSMALSESTLRANAVHQKMCRDDGMAGAVGAVALTAASGETEPEYCDDDDGSVPHVVFVVGGPCCGKESICRRLASELGYTLVAVPFLVRSAVGSGSRLGRQILKAISAGGSVPASTILGLVNKAISGVHAKFEQFIDSTPAGAQRARFETSAWRRANRPRFLASMAVLGPSTKAFRQFCC